VPLPPTLSIVEKAIREQLHRTMPQTTAAPQLFLETFATPLGPFSIATDTEGAVHATAFGNEDALHERLPSTTRSTVFKTPARRSEARAQVEDYFAKKRQHFDLPLAAHGTAFQERVWAALREIPFGATTSYGALAAQLGSPRAARAVGSANGANPICLIVPCHRVIAANGSLGGFAFGLEIKQALLAHEQAQQ